MTKGKAGHYWQRIATSGGFTPMAVILSGVEGGTYAIPDGATSMKAWAVGAGSNDGLRGGAGGVAYKSWLNASGLTGSVDYTVGDSNASIYGSLRNSTASYDGSTITGNGATSSSGATYSGGDGGANGGDGTFVDEGEGLRMQVGGAVGGNSASLVGCGRRPATDVDGLLAAVALAGGIATEACGGAAFGSGASYSESDAAKRKPGGFGGGGAAGVAGYAPGGAVVLYFT